ncbi:unnamed protein product [Dovyalis caffra]|uniref:Disease resistance protein At4g27190-like leucine-rich repeats domain-containing protein n=1 Tax=Dovyalis caffra TaxID=77055 RepID=A0AAV1RVT1_9ROSI|nr:unnamed protein product [Dovyalis caffra]
MDKILFPSLEVIVLDSLPKLTGICSGTAILEIPSLERISIDNCPNMKAFVSSFLKEQEPRLASEGEKQRLDKGDHDISTPPLFNQKVSQVAFSNLKNLRMGWIDIMEVIQHDQFRTEYFCKLEVLELVQFPSDYVDFPFHFLRRFTNLKNLVLSDAAFKEIVLHEETDGEEKHMGIVVQLKQLELSKLPKLVYLSKEGPESLQIFQKLETLKVLECGVVKILMPSALSFQCLQILEVSNCHRLINLMTSSTAKQLVELKRMSITKCEMIVEIVASEENEVENEVVFHKMEHMKLHSLPSLTSFYSRNCAFMFPSLAEVLVVECPNMKYFAPGVISTPELDRADGSAQSKLPSSSKQPTCETTDANDLKIVSERLASEDLPVTKNPDSSKHLLLMVETILETKEHAITGASIEPEIAQLTSASQDSHATSNEKEDPAQGQNSSTPVDIESHISLQVQKDPQAADKKMMMTYLVFPAAIFPASSIQQINLPALKGQDSWATSNNQEDASQENFSTPTSAETYISPQVQMDLSEIDKDQILHASSIESCSNLVPTSPASSVQQVPALPSPSHTDFETLIISMERMLHPSSASSSQPSSSSNSRYQSHESVGVSFETYTHSVARMKKILVKSPTEVASSVDRFLLLSALMNLRNCQLLNSQQLEIVQVYIENFDSLVTNNPSYEQQIDSTSALKFAMEDNKNRISELMNRYEDLTSKSSSLNVNKQALKRKLHEIEVEEARICDDMDDLRAQLVTRKEKLETHMKVLPEAEKQQREAVERASNINDNWAKIRSLFA